MSYKIFISTFGKKTIRVKNGIPIEVGAANRGNYKYPQKDNTGDNISSENPYYGELTGLYWIWKNVEISDNDIIGYCHYNKAFNISESKAESWLKANPKGIITLTPGKIRNHPVEDECKALFDVLKESPLYYTACVKLYDNEFASKYANCRGGNMLICGGDTFKSYCSWLFAVLKEVRIKVGDKPEADNYWRRYCAYMGERLLSVYIEANQLPNLGVGVRLKKWWIPYLAKVRKCLHIGKDSFIYQTIYKRLGYKSSYKTKD